MSMTLVPVCWQTTVTAENKKECALAHSRAEARVHALRAFYCHE